MNVEDYFEFTPHGEIKLKGHRVYLEDVLLARREHDLTDRQLFEHFTTLSPDKVYACLLYYHANRERVDAYLADYVEHRRRSGDEAHRANPELYDRLRTLKEDRLAGGRRLP